MRRAWATTPELRHDGGCAMTRMPRTGTAPASQGRLIYRAAVAPRDEADELLPWLRPRDRPPRSSPRCSRSWASAEQTILVGSVGCSVFAYDYLRLDSVESPHGRAAAVATGVKRYRPDRIVFTYQGDGDLAAIGTAEIVHAAARGERFTTIFVNNGIYGMTGGQMAPTTLPGPEDDVQPAGPRRVGDRLPAARHGDAVAAAGRALRGTRVGGRSRTRRQDEGGDQAGVRGPARGSRASRSSRCCRRARSAGA